MDLEKPITTQEDLDAIIQKRLAREQEAMAKKYGDYDDLRKKASEADTRIADLTKQLETATGTLGERDKTVTELQGKISGLERESLKARIAHEIGLPYELAGRLNGTDEKALREDAAALKGLFGTKPAPLAATETPNASGDQALRDLAKGLMPK